MSPNYCEIPGLFFVYQSMGRRLRHLPGPDHLVEITCRAIQRRFLLRPSPELRAIICGALARFQQRHAMKICGFVYLSNHCHVLLRPDSVEQLAAFMRDVNSKIAREVGRLHDWRGGIWDRAYTHIVVSHEPEAQVARLRYLLEQGCKEGLVSSPQHWPGATSVRALTSGAPVEGLWIDRTAQYKAWECGEPNPDSRFTTSHRIEISSLPCWDDLQPYQWQTRVRAMVREIESGMGGVRVLGTKAVCALHPHSRPASNPQRRPAPRFHAIEPQVRRALEWGYRLFCQAYRQACVALREGRPAEFPEGCFIPGRVAPLRT